jgi:hypothetical protein
VIFAVPGIIHNSWEDMRMSGKCDRADFFLPDPGWKISIAIATLPENLIRINRILIENFPAGFDFFFNRNLIEKKLPDSARKNTAAH